MSMEDLQFSNLCQHFWDHLLQKSYIEVHVWFWESRWLSVFFVFLQLTVCENEVINVRYTILNGAYVYKNIIFPSSVIFPMLHRFKTFCILVLFFTKSFCVCSFWLQKKHTPKVFIVFVVKSKYMIIKTVILTPFKESMAATI